MNRKSDSEILLELLGESCCCECECERERTQARGGVRAPTLPSEAAPVRPQMFGKKAPPLTVVDLETPFVPAPLTSTDSPQRPGNWGAVHQPRVLNDGNFACTETTVLFTETLPLVVVSDLGLPQEIPRDAPIQVNHDTRTVTWRSAQPTGVPDFGDLARGQTQLEPNNELPYGFNNRLVVFVIAAVGAVSQSYQTLETVYGYMDGSVQTQVIDTVQQGIPVDAWSYKVRELNDGSFTDYFPTRFRFVGIAGSADSSDVKIEADLGDRWVTLPVANNSSDYRFPPDAQPGQQVTGEPFRAFATLTASGSEYHGVPFPDGIQWRAGGITLQGPPGPRPAVLTGRTLHAFGQEFIGSSWAALCRAEGQTVLLIDTGSNVLRVDSSGIQTAARADLETVLGASLSRFSDVGPLSNSWPPQWAWGICPGDFRALGNWEPWRDTPRTEWVAAKLSKPRRRPSEPLPAAQSPPTPPLSLALADVGGMLVRDELLIRGQAPFLRPVRVEVQKADKTWVDSPVALQALNKRVLYSPANWPEELDDRTFTRSPVRVHFEPGAGGPQASITLLIRTRPGKRLPGSIIMALSASTPPIGFSLLGHDAPDPSRLRAWHPCLLDMQGEWQPSSPPVITLPALPLSRVLLCLTGLPVTQGGGGSS